jgi:hypothetical protein
MKESLSILTKKPINPRVLPLCGGSGFGMLVGLATNAVGWLHHTPHPHTP